MKTIVIAGANGFLGRCLSRYFLKKGWKVIGLARKRDGLCRGVCYQEWDGETLEHGWGACLEGAELLVNLAGRSVNCRYNEENRRCIRESRVNSTVVLGQAIDACNVGPRVWMNSSTATIYRHAEDRAQGDYDGELGKGFSVEVARAWENAFYSAPLKGDVRKIALRSAIVMGEEPDTVWTVLQSLARLGMGGQMGHGRQMVSWVHVEDFCRAVLWLYECDHMSGNINLCAPNPVSNTQLMKLVRKSVGRKWAFPIPRWALELGALIRGTETELVLKSRWVLPTRLEEHGFVFDHPDLETSFVKIAVDG